MSRLLGDLGVEMDFECSTVCPILPGLMGIWQKGLGSYAIWWNTEIKVSPTQVYEQMGHPVVFLILPERRERGRWEPAIASAGGRGSGPDDDDDRQLDPSGTFGRGRRRTRLSRPPRTCRRLRCRSCWRWGS